MDPGGAGGRRRCAGQAEPPLPAPAGPRRCAAEPGDSPGAVRAATRLGLGWRREGTGVRLGNGDSPTRTPAGTVGWSQCSPLQVLRAGLGYSRRWDQANFRFVLVSPPKAGAERGIAVVRSSSLQWPV